MPDSSRSLPEFQLRFPDDAACAAYLAEARWPGGAWLLCAKLRRAMVAPDRQPLAGLVEVDKTTIPWRSNTDPPVGVSGRSRQGKLLVASAVEVHDDRPGHLRPASRKWTGSAVRALLNSRFNQHRILEALGR